MTPKAERPRFSNDAKSNLIAMCQEVLNPHTFQALDDRTAPTFDHSVKTVFLKRTIARAMTPKAQDRIYALRRMEGILSIQAEGSPIGPARGHLLGSIARAFPVSNRAMRLELLGLGVQHLVEVAEQVELRLMVAPRQRLPRRR